MNLIKVKRSCAARQPHSLVQTPSGPSGKTRSRRLEMGLGAVDDHQCPKCFTELSVHSTMHCWRMPSCPFHLQEVSPHNLPKSRLHTLGQTYLEPPRTEVLGPSPGFARLSKRFTGVWSLHVLQLLGATGES